MLSRKTRLRRPLALAAALLGATLLVAGPAGAVSVKKGQPAPELSLVTLSGETVTSADLKGKVVLLDFWATWCKPCVWAIPELKALRKDLAGEPFVLVSLSVDRNGRQLREFVQKHGMDWPQFWDEKRQVVFPKFGVQSFPTYLVLDHEGKVAFHKDGWAEERTDREVRAAINKALKKAKKAQAAPAR